MRCSPLVLCLLVACHKDKATSSAAGSAGAAGGSTEQPSDGAAPRTADTVLSARCHPTEGSIRLDNGGGLDDLEIGDAVAYHNRYGVSLLRRAKAGRLAAVALLGADATDARLVDLVPALGDAPPPRLAACRDALVAVSFGLPRADAGSGDLVVSVVDPPQEQLPVLIPQHRDDSLSFDFACSGGGAGLVVWDETVSARGVGAPSRGVVRAAAFDVGHPDVRVRDVSPPDSDAEMPRIVAYGAGFFVLWIARRPEGRTSDTSEGKGESRTKDGPSALEMTGETRSYGWLEMTSVDFQGRLAGPVRRLTPASGHVSAYDVRALDGSTPGVAVVVRDDNESIDGAGGTLLRARALVDEVEEPSVVRTDGLGRGPPTFVEGPAPWLTWVSPGEQLRLLPLGAGVDLDAAASAENGLEEARPLLSLPGGDKLLVATPRDPLAQLRVFACHR